MPFASRPPPPEVPLEQKAVVHELRRIATALENIAGELTKLNRTSRR